MEVGVADAGVLGIVDGDLVKVISPAGEITTAARVVTTLPRGMLFMPVSFPESPVNELFDIILDIRTGSPTLKACAVKLERIEDSGGA